MWNPENTGRKELLLLDSLDGAVLGASAAVDAGVSVDLVMISALGDGLVGANTGAGAAGNAAVGNDVHGLYLLFRIRSHCNI